VQALQWAITNRALAQFDYSELTNGTWATFKPAVAGGQRQPDTVMAQILMNAMQGFGTYVSNDLLVLKDTPQRGSGYSHTILENKIVEGRQHFREALGKALHQLTAIEPTFTYCDNAQQWMIYLN
jgi:hypothetical protein